VLGGVGHHVAQRAAQVRGVCLGREARLAGIHLQGDALLPIETVQRGGGFRQQSGHLNLLGACLQRRSFGGSQLPHLHDHAPKGGRGRAGSLQVGGVRRTPSIMA
jgi:hypothetical protein